MLQLLALGTYSESHFCEICSGRSPFGRHQFIMEAFSILVCASCCDADFIAENILFLRGKDPIQEFDSVFGSLHGKGCVEHGTCVGG